MRLAIATAIWQRPEVFRIFAANTIKLISESKAHEFKVFCVGSEGEVSESLAKDYGFAYIEHPNKPLWAKWNAVVKACESWQPDYVLMMGSDDVMDAKLLNNYRRHMNRRVDFIGCLDWYFYDLRSGAAIYWGGYKEISRRGKTVGAGRMLSSDLLTRLNWQPWQQPKDGEGMDGTMMRRLEGIPYTKAAIRMGDGTGVDIKSDTNITTFAMWPNSRPIKPEVITTRFHWL